MNVKIDGQKTKIRKQRLCWLVQSDSVKISSDIKKRFIPQRSIAIHDINQEGTKLLWKSDNITRGDLIIISENKQLICGNVLSFKKNQGKSKKDQTYLKDYIDIKSQNDVSFLLDPVYEITRNLSLKKTPNAHNYYHQNLYVCHEKDISVNLKTVNAQKMLKSFLKK